MTNVNATTPPTTRLRLRLGWGQLLALGLVLGLLAIVAVALQRAQQGQVGVGEPAPAFSVTSLDGTELAGTTFNLTSARGQVVLVNFWASWCVPCRDEAADLEAAWQLYRDRGVIVVGLAWSDTERASLEFINEFNQTYINGPDLATRAGQAYRIQGVPETFLIDRDGVIRWVKIGPTNLAELRSQIEPLLGR